MHKKVSRCEADESQRRILSGMNQLIVAEIIEGAVWRAALKQLAGC